MTKTIRAAAAALALLAGVGSAQAADASPYLQCAPFARMFSGVQLFGAAASWWNQAVGRYAEGAAPRLGSVLVFKALGSMRSGHVATVTRIVSDRIIKVTHANWGGMKGQVERDVTVIDASPRGDWSQVRVWYAPIGDVGTKAYPTYGFIYGGAREIAGEGLSAARGLVAKAGAALGLDERAAAAGADAGATD